MRGVFQGVVAGVFKALKGPVPVVRCESVSRSPKRKGEAQKLRQEGKDLRSLLQGPCLPRTAAGSWAGVSRSLDLSWLICKDKRLGLNDVQI